MTVCSSPPTTMTMTMPRVTVDLFIVERGGIIAATIQISTGSMGTQIEGKGSIGHPGEVSITQ